MDLLFTLLEIFFSFSFYLGIGKLLTPMKRAIIIVETAIRIVTIVATGFHDIDLAASRPLTINRVFWHHPYIRVRIL